MNRKPRYCLFSKDLPESITPESKKECLESIPFFDDIFCRINVFAREGLF